MAETSNSFASYEVSYSQPSAPVIPPVPVLDSYVSALKEATEGLTSYQSKAPSKQYEREDFDSKSHLTSPPKPLASRSHVQSSDTPPPPLKIFDVGTTSSHVSTITSSQHVESSTAPRNTGEAKPSVPSPSYQPVPISKPLTIDSFSTSTSNLPLDSPVPPRPPPPPDMMSPTPPVVPPPPVPVPQSSASTRNYDRPDNFARPYTSGIFRSESSKFGQKQILATLIFGLFYQVGACLWWRGKLPLWKSRFLSVLNHLQHLSTASHLTMLCPIGMTRYCHQVCAIRQARWKADSIEWNPDPK